MTQSHTSAHDANSHNADTPNAPDTPHDANTRNAAPDAPEPLPQQDALWRAPARFGNVPVDAEPKGWDRQRRFEKHYPRVDLPTQITERVQLGRQDAHEPNRLIWGDNLHILRQIPNNSVDLIYIDPPFFSGRQYNVIWGDNNELRSFNDIWEGGLDGYLIWLNARLYEMKRILKPTGSIYVHCDWHASHYIKVEMDKIFGYDNFRNQIVWKRRAEAHNLARRNMGRIHDIILYYVKSDKAKYRRQYTPYSDDYIKRHYQYSDDNGVYTTFPCTNEAGGNRPYNFRGIVRSWRFTPENMEAMFQAGLLVQTAPGRPFRYKKYLKDADGVPLQDFWDDINPERGKGAIGYPTQKPMALLERIIKASSNEGDVVLDAFVGGGTTAEAAMRLQRNFICIDQSRVAVAVTAERLKRAAVAQELGDGSYPDFTVEQWGIYEAERLSAMPADQFREFTLKAYGATRIAVEADGEFIHGWRNQLPIWVGDPALDSQATAADVREFANAVRRTTLYQQANLRDGTMLAWGFRQDAEDAADQLRHLEGIEFNFIRLNRIRIGDAEFREHIIGRSTDRADYSEFLTFIQPPVVEVAHRANGGRAVTFDAGDSVVVNSDAKIINVQWDFDYNGVRFAAAPGYTFQKGRGNNKKPQLQVTHKFNRAGRFRVACRVQDSRGGEGMWTGEVEAR